MQRHHGDLNHRGPLFILVIWIVLALLACIALRTSILSGKYTNDAILVTLHAVYFLSLLPNGSSTYVQRRAMQSDVSIFKGNSFLRKVLKCTSFWGHLNCVTPSRVYH